MRSVGQTKKFNRDIRKLLHSEYRDIINFELHRIIEKLANDEPLDNSYRDHSLIGNWKGNRECHLAFDLVLIYKIEDDDILELARIGSHSEVLRL